MKCLIIKILLILIPSIIFGQNPDVSNLQKKIALIIGNGNYNTSVLANPENDAKSMAEILQKLGFIVYKYENLNQIQMKKAIDDFGLKLKGNDVGLFYYAGHGIQTEGFNYLIPVDATLKTEEQVEYDCIRADRILSLMEISGSKVNVIILDACRNNPFERSWTRSPTGRGLAFMSAPKGTLIAYATAPGSTASDGSGKNKLYTAAILESISIPNISIEAMFKNVRRIVSSKSQNQQMPWESTSLTGDFYFNVGDEGGRVISPSVNEIESSLDKTVAFITDWTIDNLQGKVRSLSESSYRENFTYENYLSNKTEYILAGKKQILYNNQGYRTLESEYSDEFTLSYRRLYIYEGSLIKCVTTNTPQFIESMSKQAIYLEKESIQNYRVLSNTKKEAYPINDSDEKIEFEYFIENGKLIKITGVSRGRWFNEYKYDQNGNIIEHLVKYDSGGALSTYYKYVKFDKFHNWLVRFQCIGDPSCKLPVKEERTIEYY